MLTSPIILSLLVLLMPLMSFVVLYFWGNKLPRKGDWLATGVMALCLFISMYLFSQIWAGAEIKWKLDWFSIPGTNTPFSISILLNPLASLMIVVVTLISLLVHLYSIEYMYDKKNYTRYFPYLGLFTSSMIGIVLSDNLLITFMCWEAVGFASYLLIGFWTEKQAAARAAKKAFLINRIGDAGFIIGLLIVYIHFGHFELSEISKTLPGIWHPRQLICTLAALGIFMGCVGKSAQFPLQLWLPDAMEGPTPASALIHAATMVAAGIYLLAKTYFLLTPDTKVIIAFVGAVTALSGALPAVAQTDIKKVLAYSTISQLGFMVMAMGVNAPQAALFHLVTHACFKACLFLTAGAVIHEMHHVKQSMFVRGYFTNFDTLNMKLMGGLRSKMPLTFLAYTLSALSLIGVPLFSGFLSKDAILEGTVSWAIGMHRQTGSFLYYLIPCIAVTTISITAYYMIRQALLVFFGGFKLQRTYPAVADAFQKVHDPGWLMKLPMLLLAFLSTWIIFAVNPFDAHHSWVIEKLVPTSKHTISALQIALASITAVALGVLVAWIRFRSQEKVSAESEDSFLQKLFKNNWYLDKVYHYTLTTPGIAVASYIHLIDRKIIDGILHSIAYIGVILAHILALVDRYIIDGLVAFVAYTASLLGSFGRRFQQGNVQGYFVFSLSILAALVVWVFYKIK